MAEYFVLLDTNNDGIIQESEFDALLKAQNQQDLCKIFQVIDMNHNKFISQLEWNNFLDLSRDVLLEHFGFSVSQKHEYLHLNEKEDEVIQVSDQAP